jgi:tRNA-intron endonuclease, archaea type
MIEAVFEDGVVVAQNCDGSRDLNNQSLFGSLLDDGRLQLSVLEGLYLVDKRKIKIVNSRGVALTRESILRKIRKVDKDFRVRYSVFKDLRKRGYIVKTALKFGADFRVYNRGVKPGEDHAKWVVYPVQESKAVTWYEFAAKNRVAHSTKKKLLLGVVDDENSISYWEVRWLRP